MKDYDFEPGYEHLRKEDPPSNGGPGKQPGSEDEKLIRYMDSIRPEQNLQMAILGGLGGAAIGAVIWGLITYFAERQSSIIAILVGFIVGFAVRKLGNGVDQIFGVVGAGFASLGIFIGNFVAMIFLLTKYQPVTFFEVVNALLVSPQIIFELFVETFQLIHIFYYGLAIYVGYRFAFRKITQQEVDRASGQEQSVSL